MNKNTVKTVLSVVGGIGVNAVVSNLVKATTPIDLKLLDKVWIGIGSLTISSMAGKAVEEHMDWAVDKYQSEIDKMKEELEKVSEGRK